jgi:hypothetical protein
MSSRKSPGLTQPSFCQRHVRFCLGDVFLSGRIPGGKGDPLRDRPTARWLQVRRLHDRSTARCGR